MNLFESFIGILDELELPLVLSRELQMDISQSNDPMPSDFVQKFLPELNASWDEFTELIPVGKISYNDHFIAVLFWKAGLMSYEFILYTYAKDGTVIDSDVLASTQINGDKISEEVAIIEDDLLIFKARSSAVDSENNIAEVDEKSKSTHMIKENGAIVQL